jgi:large subunit ribosomal protein L3
MALGLIGKKRGMTRIFTADGQSIPVTVIEVLGNRVTAMKTMERDGYRAVQVTAGQVHRNRITKPLAGIYAKAEVEAGTILREFRLGENEGEGLAPGKDIGVDLFSAGQKVDVTGKSIGKGFAGVIKRHHFSSQDATHGNSVSTRVGGSIGHCQDPGRVFKGKRMAGHLGNAKRTQQGLSVVRVDVERSLLLIKGGVPGAKGADVIVHPSTKV